jgi:hypothetical protein
MKNKYNKFKKKYLELKGGEIYYNNETLENKSLNIIYEEYISSNDQSLIDMKRFCQKNNFSDKIMSKINKDDLVSLIDNKELIIWCLEPNDIYINDDCETYFNCRFQFIIYHISIQNVRRLTNIFQIDSIQNDSYALFNYTLYGTIFGKRINLFNTFYNDYLIHDIYLKILEWLTPKTEKENRDSTFIYTKFVLNKDDRIKQIFFSNYNSLDNTDEDFKIHMNVKLEYIFFILDILLKNYKLFEDCLSSFKINVNFYLYRIGNQIFNRSSTSFNKFALVSSTSLYKSSNLEG